MSIMSSRKKFSYNSVGLQVIHERRFDQKLSQFSVYVNIGSALETKKQKGISHLVEHLMFKSTLTATAEEISTKLEKYGAIVNAYTTYDTVCFHFKVLNEYLKKCLIIFSDMLFNKSITEDEFLKEKQIVIQELCRDLDDPMMQCVNTHIKQLYKMDPVIGYRDIVEKITLSDINSYISNYFLPQNMIISVVSNKSHYRMKRYIQKYFINQSSNLLPVSTEDKWDDFIEVKSPISFNNKIFYKHAKTEQVQISLSIPLKIESKDLYKVTYLNTLCTGGLSSILFKELREYRGLCYGFYLDTGFFTNKQLNNVYPITLDFSSSTEVQHLKPLIDTVISVLSDLSSYISQDDIQRVNTLYKMKSLKVENYNNYNYDHFKEKHSLSLDTTTKKLQNMTLKKITKFIKNAIPVSEDTHSVPYLITVYGNIPKKYLTKLPKCCTLNKDSK